MTKPVPTGENGGDVQADRASSGFGNTTNTGDLDLQFSSATIDLLSKDNEALRLVNSRVKEERWCHWIQHLGNNRRSDKRCDNYRRSYWWRYHDWVVDCNGGRSRAWQSGITG